MNIGPDGPTADLAGKTVTVMGIGRFGGGIGVARWLCGQGARVTLTDLSSADRLRDPLATIADLVQSGQIRLRLDRHEHADFTDCDLLVANPAVQMPWRNEFIKAAQRAGVPMTTEIRLLVERLDRRSVIGITGTAGKSTTAAMVTHILRRHGEPAHLGGNIGGSLLEILPRIGRDDPVVLELSSFMLHWLGAGVSWPTAPAWWPETALLTNLSPNHLDWHGDFEHYSASKRNIFGPSGAPAGTRHFVGSDLPERVASIELSDRMIAVPGAHNRQNARMAIAIAAAWLDAPPEELIDDLRSFRGLTHRMEVVSVDDSRRFINDSKSTTPEATLHAVAAMTESVAPTRIHLIAGGYDKGSDLGAITALAANLGGLYAIGATADRIAQHRNALKCDTLDVAIARALERMGPDDVLLLSPGCASWDQFDNYEERGERFRHLVVMTTSGPEPK